MGQRQLFGGTFPSSSPSPSAVGFRGAGNRRRHEASGTAAPPACCLYRGDDLARIRADHREAENAVVIWADKDFHEALCLVGHFPPVHGTHRQFADAHGNALSLCVQFAQPDMRKRWIGEHAVQHQPVARAARAAGQVVADDAKIIDRSCVNCGLPAQSPTAQTWARSSPAGR